MPWGDIPVARVGHGYWNCTDPGCWWHSRQGQVDLSNYAINVVADPRPPDYIPER